MALVKMEEQFAGLPMGSLIGGPLKAAIDSQTMLAKSTAEFISLVGFEDSSVRTVLFEYKKTEAGEDGTLTDSDMQLTVPLLAVVPIPNLQIDFVNITFDMEVKSAEGEASSSDKEASVDATAKGGWGPFSASVTVSGKVATHRENTRSSDNSAKYHVEVNASNHGYPEGLARVMDIIAGSVTPKPKS